MSVNSSLKSKFGNPHNVSSATGGRSTEAAGRSKKSTIKTVSGSGSYDKRMGYGTGGVSSGGGSGGKRSQNSTPGGPTS